MMKNIRLNSSGFTLIELMLAMAISLFLIGGVVLIQSSSRATSAEAENLSRMQENIRFTTDLMVRDIRNAGFRDQLSLTSKQFKDIGTNFARIQNKADEGPSLEIAYAGWESCSDGFEIIDATNKVPSEIRNRYFVQNGELKCVGSKDGAEQPPVALASRIESANFELLCPGGASATSSSPPTSSSLWVNGQDFEKERTSLQDACHGVKIMLTYEAVNDDVTPVTVEVTAGFRNILLGQLMWQAVCQLVDSPTICSA